MANPLKHIDLKPFSELTKEELISVFYAYCETNKYFDYITLEEHLDMIGYYGDNYTMRDVYIVIGHETNLHTLEYFFEEWMN